MTVPQPREPSGVGLLGQCLQDNKVRILSECAAAFVSASRDSANQAILEAVQTNLPRLLDELSSVLPQVMAAGAEVPSMPAGGIECQAGHRLDAVIKALSGISEVVVLEFLRLKGCVDVGFLNEACREARLFFDLKAANYCLQFVKAQEGEITLRTRQLGEAKEGLMRASELSMPAAHSRLHLMQGVTHELRNSLQSVLLYATSLIESPRDQGAAEVVERLGLSGMLLQKLLDRIRQYSPFLAGEWRPWLEPVDVATFLNELALRHRVLAGAARTQLACKQTHGPAVIITDPGTLNLIADNLVSNAIRSAKRGLVQVEVSEDGPERILLTVTDNGDGISLVEARQIFRVMHHVSGSHSSGLKLGLLASRYLTHLLGGEITFESEAGKGTTFKVALPRLTASR